MRTIPWIVVGIVALVSGGGCKRAKSPSANPLRPLTQVKDVLMPQVFQGVELALERYQDENGRYPERLPELVPAFLSREDDLIDSWGTSLRLRTGEEGAATFLESAGPDRSFDTPDDLARRLQ